MAALKARASPVEQITKGIDARADLQSVEPSPEWQSPPAKRIRASDDGPAPIADPRPTYRRRQSAVFQRGGASQRPTVAPAGYANARFAVAQNAQDSNRGVDTTSNLVNG